MSNNVISTNPTVANIDITTAGSNFLWWVFAMMITSALGLTAYSLTLNPARRAFHFLGVAILFTASIAYFSMASDLGATPILVEFVRNQGDLATGFVAPTRSIWYVRYIDWVITTPLLLLTLLLSTGMPLSGIFATIFFDIIMIVTGLVGALVHSSYKWGYFAFGCLAMLYVFWTLIGPARLAAKALGDDNHQAYIKGALSLSFLWMLYPIAWGLCDGGNVISVNGEMIFYGILDVLAKPGFIFLHLYSIRNIDYDRFGLESGHRTIGQAVSRQILLITLLENPFLTQLFVYYAVS
ncbi:uncharacterized protein MELLADRAFT_39586 [Melampsora larici-populina 98AG31]|uniref:Family A G protein-coupled receptor-like protein n=1 Tax=Melampsora larici-populina (strain 98AG31 / pathotype 3-4-7) TaxID=747676 RepID=F4S423_MELLP|nr:uncharacterized protein MELLADRAFT_39586 [Melampsora larici-populina 98AG31]EGG00632.1 hypothetical protein MELLADRAFT_39586 [Melampsora larici-populina 98AG31]